VNELSRDDETRLELLRAMLDEGIGELDAGLGEAISVDEWMTEASQAAGVVG
jgi:hypothetical protein